MALVPTPQTALFTKTLPGVTETSYSGSVLKFMGCSVVSCTCSVGFNGSPSSLQVTLVEDVANGDAFTDPSVPSFAAFSLPKGGVGTVPIMSAPSGSILDPGDFNNSNAPFYFAGIVSSCREDIRNISGRTIQVSLVDPREVLGGVQCLLNGFALSQNLGGGTRYSNVYNVIDCFGYFDNGMTSDANEQGLSWNKIRECLLTSRVSMWGLSFEFYFVGDAFNDCPDWYRIDGDVVDLMSVVSKVCTDAGSDLVCISRLMDVSESPLIGPTIVVEFRSLPRTATNALTRAEVESFISDRSSIVSSASIAKEFRNEPTHSVIIGGRRNKNYVAYPTPYDSGLHLSSSGVESYELFDPDIKNRLFDLDGRSPGAIFPYWGMSPSGDVPLIEPFLSLDHIAVDTDAASFAKIKTRIPLCEILVDNFVVRDVSHDDVFLDGDGDADSRPFAYLNTYIIGASGGAAGFCRGLPLNTEILRASLISSYTFFNVYTAYYPDVANSLGFSSFAIDAFVSDVGGASNPTWVDIGKYFGGNAGLQHAASGLVGLTDNEIETYNKTSQLLDIFNNNLYQFVRKYAEENMGKRFLVALPRSEIMHRIWDGDPVPTREFRPQIEYTVQDRGYWEVVPDEFNGIGASGAMIDREEQIRRRFMAEDGRFYAMAIMDWKPKGNASFNSNGLNKAMFEDLPVSEFRPNRIAEGNPDYVCISCDVQQLVMRPDLALVSLPNAVDFDPTDTTTENNIYGAQDTWADDERLITYRSVSKMVKVLRQKIPAFATVWNGVTQKQRQIWIRRLIDLHADLGFDKEKVMDLKAVIIPLESTWVTYGPYYYDSLSAVGCTNLVIEDELVPWNFSRSYPWYANLDAAGADRLARSFADLQQMTSATMTCAGFPEFGPADHLVSGAYGNLTGITVNFGIGGITTTYDLSTYTARPGTYRKGDYDNLSRTRYDTRPRLPETENINITQYTERQDGITNQFFR